MESNIISNFFKFAFIMISIKNAPICDTQQKLIDIANDSPNLASEIMPSESSEILSCEYAPLSGCMQVVAPRKDAQASKSAIIDSSHPANSASDILYAAISDLKQKPLWRPRRARRKPYGC